MTEAPSPPHSRRALVLVWLVLVVSTVAAWWFAPGHTTELVALVVALAVVKCRLVIRWFMEVRAAPRWLRLGTDAWLVLLWAGLAGVYFWG
ncbi:cytochrome C oxidase subunit IV family protein [Nocardia jiangsuensis]|uniref:Cytochrome C oxidase subunit IV family protein n=1 Tax=Nocardia jiangsuensis TaxID=1691563 RepID=A0ABV8DYJ9_9NOCA